MSRKQSFLTLTADEYVAGGQPDPLEKNFRPHVDANDDGPLVGALDAAVPNFRRRR